MKKLATSTSGAQEQTKVESFLTVKKYTTTDSRQTRATDALTSLVAELMLPLSIVESPAFKKFTDSLDSRFAMPSRKHLSSTLLTKKHEAIMSKMNHVLDEVDSVSLTLDLWSNRQMRGFMGITCHFIMNWSMQSLMLACRRFIGRHTTDNIAQYYHETVTSNKISSTIVTIVTDNASNEIKAVSIPGFHDSTSLNEVGEDEEDEDDDNEMEICNIDDTTFLWSSEHDTCFAHTLQLVVKDGLQEIGPVKTILSKVAIIVSHVHRSQYATEILEGERKLQQKNATRWNSELRSIKSILRVPDDKLQLLNTVHLTAYDRKILEDLVHILSPFLEATNFAQGQNVVTSSLVLPGTSKVTCVIVNHI